MNLVTDTLAQLVTEETIPAFGPYSVTTVSVDLALDLIVSSTSPVAQHVNGHGDPHSVAELISSRLGVGFGSTTAVLFAFHHDKLFAVSGVIVGVNEVAIQLADENKNLHTWPIARVFALIAD